MNQKETLYNIILVLSFVALWLSSQVPEHIEYVLGYFLILSIGVGHGANDLKIYFKDQNLNLGGSLTFIAVYVVTVVMGFIAFFIIPDYILALFLIVSGFHFGQEHFERYDFKPSVIKTLFITAYGLTIIVSLLYINASSSLAILHDIMNYRFTTIQLKWILYSTLALTLCTGIYMLKTQTIATIARELFYLVVIMVIFYSSSLVWGFAIYFIMWHSIPSINHQIEHLYTTVNKKTSLAYMKSSLLYWLAALVFLSVLYYFLSDKTALFLSVIVAFLGGITFPHVFVMHKLHK